MIETTAKFLGGQAMLKQTEYLDNKTYFLSLYDNNNEVICHIRFTKNDFENLISPHLRQEQEGNNKMNLHNVSTDYIMKHGNKIESLSNSEITVIECKNYNQFVLSSKSITIIGEVLKFSHKLGQLEIYREYLGECVLVGSMPLSCITAIDIKTTVTRL